MFSSCATYNCNKVVWFVPLKVFALYGRSKWYIIPCALSVVPKDEILYGYLKKEKHWTERLWWLPIMSINISIMWVFCFKTGLKSSTSPICFWFPKIERIIIVRRKANQLWSSQLWSPVIRSMSEQLVLINFDFVQLFRKIVLTDISSSTLGAYLFLPLF